MLLFESQKMSYFIVLLTVNFELKAYLGINRTLVLQTNTVCLKICSDLIIFPRKEQVSSLLISTVSLHQALSLLVDITFVV